MTRRLSGLGRLGRLGDDIRRPLSSKCCGGTATKLAMCLPRWAWSKVNCQIGRVGAEDFTGQSRLRQTTGTGGGALHRPGFRRAEHRHLSGQPRGEAAERGELRLFAVPVLPACGGTTPCSAIPSPAAAPGENITPCRMRMAASATALRPPGGSRPTSPGDAGRSTSRPG